MMKLSSLAFVLAAIAACGGKKSSTAPGNTSGDKASGGFTAAWAEVLIEGASWKFDNAMPDVPSDDPPTVVVATVHDVVKVGDNTRAQVTWAFADGEPAGNGLPSTVQVGPAGVWFASGGDDEAARLAGAPTFPAGVTSTPHEGFEYYAHEGTSGDLCFGEGPGPDAGECGDVCFAELCVAAGRGIVGGGGTWWPNYEMYQSVAK